MKYENCCKSQNKLGNDNSCLCDVDFVFKYSDNNVDVLVNILVTTL